MSHLTEFKEMGQFFCLKSHAIEDLQAQRVFADLVKDFDEKMPKIYFFPFYQHAARLSMDLMDEEAGVHNYTLGYQVAITIHVSTLWFSTAEKQTTEFDD